MNRQAKSAIKSLVLDLRRKLEEEIAIQLKRYGFAGERWLPVERLPHIQRDDQAAIEHFHLQAALEQHLRRIGAAPGQAKPKERAEAVDWFVREVAFTHLNRLVALKCLEVRGLIAEVITLRDAYGGRSRAHYDYRNAHPDEGRGADDGLPAAIRYVCRQVYAEFRFLFDVGDPATDHPPPVNAILWPSHPVLKECIALINGLDEAAEHTDHTLWSEDEIIGWIYQFYNAEQKEAIRRRGRPRRPAEVAVINQFFTPRWIVKFLVDNTLGRLWLEMHPDSDRVRAKCDYLVPEPLPTPESDESPSQRSGEFPLDPDSPINNPEASPRRPPKRPQDIRLIDPACGTMHFGHYAFEVFQEIYDDAHDHGWADLPSSSQGEGVGMGVASAILRHNLYGVDIDLRAVQLAGLSLFIKAKSAEPKAHISHLNLVVADAVLPADGARQRFLDQYRDDRVVQDAVRQVLEEMENVAEVGSLLRVEERLRGILERAGHEATKDQRPTTDDKPRQRAFGEIAPDPGQWDAHYTVARLLEDLRAFAAEALQIHDLNAQLFAEEAEKTVHLLDVFLNDYDVVVMNPPYGETTYSGKLYLRQVYPRTKNDIYAAFFERAVDLAGELGYVGALTSRTFMFARSFQKLRQTVLLEECRIIAVAEAGLGVLDDATVRPAATVLKKLMSVKVKVVEEQRAGEYSVFFRLADLEQKKQAIENGLANLRVGRVTYPAYVHQPKDFHLLPRSPFVYWISESLLRKFERLPPVDRDNAPWVDPKPKVADVKEGLGTRDDTRFLKHFWEVDQDNLGRNKRWIPFAKGGHCSTYYSDLDMMVNWESDGRLIKDFEKSVIRNEQFYFREGISYTRESEKATLGAYFLPEDCIFGDKGPSVFPTEGQNIWLALAVLNSAAIAGFTRMLSPDRSRSVGLVASLPFPAIVVDLTVRKLERSTRRIHNLKAAWDTDNEICTRFDAPWLIQAHRGTLLTDLPSFHLAKKPADQLALAGLLDHVRSVEQAANACLQQLQAQIDQAVYDLYEISTEDRALIERELGDRPPELVWPQMEGKSDREKRREHIRRLLSYFLLQALKERRDGILPLTPGTGQPTALEEVRRGLEAEFGEMAAFRMETEIKQILGRDIADWLGGPFCRWHTKLYKKRPIIWHLASPRNVCSCFLYIHTMDRDTLRKVQTLYLWPHRRAVEMGLESAKAAQVAGERGTARRIEQAEAALDDLAEFEKRLLSVIQAQVECDIPDWAEGPYRDGLYDPVLDDGVKVNIMPLQQAELLRYKRLV